jgi:transposase
MDERLRFVARLLEGEQMSHLCREFGISRKTGYKIFERYKDHGLEALSDRSWRPVRYANQLLCLPKTSTEMRKLENCRIVSLSAACWVWLNCCLVGWYRC